MPKFPGGNNALESYLYDDPDLNRILNKTEETDIDEYLDRYGELDATIEFVVEKNGKVGDVKVVSCNFPNPNIKNAFIKACKRLPAFSPGRNAKGEPVRVWYKYYYFIAS